MMQLILAGELARMGAIKSGPDCLRLNGVLYSRGTSFSQRVQAAAEKICDEYLQQDIKCLLVKDGPVLTLWVSHPTEEVSNGAQTPPDFQPEVVSGVLSVKPASGSQTKPSSVPTETENTISDEDTSIESPEQKQSKRQTMTYRGNTYEVNPNEEPSGPAVPSESKPENVKKRMYRGRPY